MIAPRKLMKRYFAFLFVVLFVSCSTYSVQRYSTSADNVAALGSFDVERISVGNFTSFQPGLKELHCGSTGPIKTPDGKTFAMFIRDALVADLQAAKVYEPAGLVVLTGRLDKIGFSATSGEWNIALTVKSSNGRSISVTENYRYQMSPVPETACRQTAQALMPAVQALLGEAISNPEFPNMVR